MTVSLPLYFCPDGRPLGSMTTLNACCLLALMAMVPPASGEIHLRVEERDEQGNVRHVMQRIDGMTTTKVVDKSITMVPEGRRLFGKMTVRENLDMGAFVPSARAYHAESLEGVYRIFPKLKQRAGQQAGTLSGGEQQMLAIGRALMAKPKLLLLDEPSLGLAPVVVDLIFEVLEEIKQLGVSTLLVEQHVVKALQAASRGYILEEGRIVQMGTSDELIHDEHIQRAYLAYAASEPVS